jgi:uncharacterized protein
MMNTWRPDSSIIESQLTAMRGSWADQMSVRVPAALFMETGLFFYETFWRVMSMMLLGMALYQWNILSAARSANLYLKLAILGLAVGYTLSAMGVILDFRHAWKMEYSFFLGGFFNYMGSVGTALGYIALVMLICRSGRWTGFIGVMAPVGRMAFTNYILQSVLCIFIFYGTGLGLFGSVERKIQILIVAGIWILLIVISSLWLQRFRYGPLEWIWRSLTYGKRPAWVASTGSNGN